MTDTTLTPRRQAEPASLTVLEAEAEFDDLVEAASAACGMPVSLLTLRDGDCLWSKVEDGFGAGAAQLDSSFRALTIEHCDVLEIPDMTRDPRTARNPLVTGAPYIRFYAGMPLVRGDGTFLGALCVLDTKPNRLNPAQTLILRTLARQAMTGLELRRTIRLRRESDRRNKAILDSAIDYAIVATDLTGLVTSWNTGAERILGWSEAEMRGRPTLAFITEQDVRDGIPAREMGAALLHGRSTDERWHLRKDGIRFWANGEMMPLTRADGSPEGFLKILRDRTELRDVTDRQEADAAFMRSVLASSADCIKVLDLDAKLTFMNEGGMVVMEISDFNHVRGCPWPDFWVGQGNIDALAALDAARAGGIGHFQGNANTYRGTPKWWDVQVTPILGPDGVPNKLLAVSRDISEQKAVESRLATSEERWRGLFTGMQEGFFLGELVRDPDGRATDYRFLEINPAFARQSGLPVDSIGRTMRSFVPDIDQRLIDKYAHVVETGESIAFEFDVPGLDRSFEVRANKEREDRFSCLFLDITARRQADARRTATTELGDRLRDVGDKSEIGRIAAEIMGRTLGLSHAGYGQVDVEQETILVPEGWAAPGFDSIAGLHQFRNYGSYIECLKSGEDVVIPDVTDDSRTARDAEALKAIGCRALLNLPVVEHGRFVGLFYGLKTSIGWTSEDIGFVRNVVDRTRAAVARVEAEEQQHVLNLELSHRLKNTLAMVQSIASQTLRNTENVSEAREALAARLIALGKAHDILLNGQTDSAQIAAVIDGTLALHPDAENRFRCKGPDLPVGPSAALSLGLILHELATNAAKYGALKQPDGYVDLSWQIAGRGPEAVFQLVWTEHGGPAVAAPTRTGFGSRLIRRGLAGGSVETCYPVDGIVCTLTTPLASLKAGT